MVSLILWFSTFLFTAPCLAFATPNDKSGINWEDGTQETLTKLISSARSSGYGTRIVLSIGSYYFHWYDLLNIHIHILRRLER